MTPKFNDFAGAWDLTRVITDHKQNTTAQFKGTARFETVGADLKYHERGDLILTGAKPIHAERSYLWVQSGMSVRVFFDDDRFFHSFDLSGAATSAHWCDPDQYDVAYDFSQWPHWTSTWTVTGPRKDYVMVSSYNKSI